MFHWRKKMKSKLNGFKKAIAVVCGVCLSTVLAGCGGANGTGTESGNEFTLKFWSSGLGTEFFHNLVEDFEKDTGYKVKIEENGDTNGMYDTIMLGEGYNAVDLYMYNGAGPAYFDYIEPLDDVLNSYAYGESQAAGDKKISEKITEIKNIKKLISLIKNDYKNKYTDFIISYKNTIASIQKKIIEYDNQYKEKIKILEKKYQNHLNEQIVLNNKLKIQNEELFNKKNEESIDSQKLIFKISELENELNNQKTTSKKLKNDLDLKNKENTIINEKNILIVKNLNNFLLMITKLKKKYLSIIFTLKTQINNLKDLYENDISRLMTLNTNTNNNINILNNKIAQYQQENDELREINDKIQIKLNQLIEENELKNNSINKLNEELLIRQQKINNLHNVFNKSISSYSNGIKNIQIAQKLDNDVQELIEKAKNQMSTISNYNTDNL